MNQFPSIRKLDQAILYSLELASSLSVLLLAFGLIASMANVLTKGSVLSDNLIMQRVWAWTQCIAIDASVAGTIIRTYQFFEKRSWAKFTLYALLSSLLLFTAAIVSNIESVQQTLNISLESAYIHVFVPVEALIWVRSFVIVLLIVAHALRHVQTEQQPEEQKAQPLPRVTPELLHELKMLLASTSVIEERQVTPQIPEATTATEEQETPFVALFPAVTEEERNKVIDAYRQGIQRREICSYLHWGSAKYTTIVKPVLDTLEEQQQQGSSK
jgi:hypothetical protein